MVPASPTPASSAACSRTGLLRRYRAAPVLRGDVRQRPWLYPNEWKQVATCAAVPVEWRQLYALAVYTGLRPGEVTHSVMVRVEDAQGHCERARQHGARIVMEPTDFEYGERQYTAEDHAGHRWTFSETLRDVVPEEWGGTTVSPRA